MDAHGCRRMKCFLKGERDGARVSESGQSGQYRPAHKLEKKKLVQVVVNVSRDEGNAETGARRRRHSDTHTETGSGYGGNVGFLTGQDDCLKDACSFRSLPERGAGAGAGVGARLFAAQGRDKEAWRSFEQPEACAWQR